VDFRCSLKQQKGSALVFAMGLCTLVAILATSMILSLHKDMRRYDHMRESVMDQAILRSAAAWGLSVLSDEQIEPKADQTYSLELNGVMLTFSLTEKLDETAEFTETEDMPKTYIINTLIAAKQTREGYTLLEQSSEHGWKVIEQHVGAPS
jgi:hypothetical protein